MDIHIVVGKKLASTWKVITHPFSLFSTLLRKKFALLGTLMNLNTQRDKN